MRMRFILRTLSVLCALALVIFCGAAFAAEPTGEGFTVPELTDLPEVDLSEPQFMLANSYNSIGYEYVLPQYGSFEGQGIDPMIMETTAAMVSAARAEGIPIYVSAAYRNTDYCLNHYTALCGQYGAVEACEHLLPPGCNEHQTGLAIDVTERPELSANYNVEFDDSSVYGTPTYDWMLAHCAEYGFILRYPEGKEAWYGTPCHRFHFRYVGVEAATYIMEHDLCLEEFLYLEDPHSLFVPGLNSYATD